MSSVEYPTRCRILDVEGEVRGNFILKTPVESRPHINKEGMAHMEEGRVRIQLDDGNVLYGDECWWEPI